MACAIDEDAELSCSTGFPASFAKEVFTNHNITAYVRNEVMSDPGFTSHEDQKGVWDIAGRIIREAEGVFLWVKLVLRGFKYGLL